MHSSTAMTKASNAQYSVIIVVSDAGRRTASGVREYRTVPVAASTTTPEIQDLARADCAGKTHASIAIEMHAGQKSDWNKVHVVRLDRYDLAPAAC
jgi:hypothetical protein